ncbi:MAG TPA: hypothetical protein ENN14_00765 [Chloroflexi bacterium]|nr:hypothetical protein [Chloroflexota bacterium]
MKRWWIPVGILLLLSVLLSGCAGGVRQDSWSGLIVDEGVVYAANSADVVALDATTAELLWRFPDAPAKNIGPFYATPVLAEEASLLLVAGFGDKTVYALRTGLIPAGVSRVVWTFPTETNSGGLIALPWQGNGEGAGGQYVGSGVVADGLFIIGNGDGFVYALNLSNGAQVWAFQTGGRVWADPVVVDDEVYVASMDGHVYALNLADGTLRWQQELDAAVTGTPAVVGDALWVGDFSGQLYQLSLADGNLRQTFTGNDWFWAAPLGVDERLFAVDISGYVYALDALTGEALWPAPAHVDDLVRGQPALTAEGVLLVPGHESGLIYALDAETGDPIPWGLAPERPGRLPSDVVVVDERVYVMPIQAEARIRVFSMSNGALLWQYPAATQ